MSRPLMTVVGAMQHVIDDLRQEIAVQSRQIALIARLAGITPEITRLADINNPAQPIEDGPEQPASESSEEAVTPVTHDDVRAPGQTGGSTQHVPAATTDVAINPGGTLPAEPYNNLVDVTSPVAGTNTGEIPPEETRIETDVRAMDPMQPEVAFPWTISPNQSNSNPPHDGEMAGGKTGSRYFAALRLARLRIQARLAAGDDITLAASIEADAGLTDTIIDHEINVLSSLADARKGGAAAPDRATVPRRAAQAARTAPSLAEKPGTASTDTVDDDMFLGL
ncbi:hypothetical protein ACFZAM_31210 [Streptomyces sp. NPDC008079]|uniref:hypothetical protein n=1 Tax=Streptomyces sp. NPDC008079 TaxID=3364806 RepID=UPI0036E6A9A0